jgi:hypothetical protein
MQKSSIISKILVLLMMKVSDDFHPSKILHLIIVIYLFWNDFLPFMSQKENASFHLQVKN